MEFTQVIEKRYSCKNFGERKVEDAKLRAILEAGRLAPTASRSSASMSSSRQRGWRRSTRLRPAATAHPPA